MTAVSTVPKRSHWLLVIAGVVVGYLGGWWAFSADHDGPAAAGTPAPAESETQVHGAPKVRGQSPRTSRTVASRASEHDRSAGASVHPGLIVVGPGPHDPHEPGMVPHPLDATRKRINAENQLLQSLNDAMSFRKVLEMRALLVEYRKLDPSDMDAHQLGYDVIADCIEFPGEASLTAAREFYDTQRHSSLRRFVRRICFENRN